jgi:hypothetical protein
LAVIEPSRFFAAWRSQTLAGAREVTEGQLLDEHRGPSPALVRALRDWPGTWYWADPDRRRLVLVRGTAPPRPERWLWHGALLWLTVITTLAAGAIITHAWRPAVGATALGGVTAFLGVLADGGPRVLLAGWSFAGPLLLILLVHEAGHYVAARRYAIDVSPPYFLPVPPTLFPIGTLGAFIRIRTPVYDRRQLLDVGAAGPLAGFLVAVVVLWWGYRSSIRVPGSEEYAPTLVALAGRPIAIGDSLLTGVFRDWLLPGNGPVVLSAQAFAGWVGMFVTSLNLLPLSQLDGGHVLYGLLGRRQVPVALVTVVALAWLGRAAPVWWILLAVTLVIGGGRWSHPAVIVPARPVHRRGWRIGLACGIVFALTFVPLPFGH